MAIKTNKYLVQSGTGRIYIFSKELAKRKDMAEFDPDRAKIRIERKKRHLEDLQTENRTVGISKEILDTVAEETAIDKQIEAIEMANLKKQLKEEGVEVEPETKTEEELEQEAREQTINNDPDIKKIEAMTSIDEVEEYIAIEFGEELDMPEDADLDTYKAEALNRRINRLFESADK